MKQAPLSCFLLLCGIVILGGCTPSFDQGYTRVTTPTIVTSLAPVPKSQPILTVSGRIHQFNQGTTFVMDRNMIESLGLVETTITDPFEKMRYKFKGVLMRDLLNLWQVDSNAKILDLTALDGYRIEISLKIFKDYPVIFALQQDDQYLKANYRGPAMLVFPYESYHLPAEYNEQYWIWQIKSIVVR